MHAFFPPDLLQPCVLALARAKKRACLDLIHWLLYGGIAEGPAQDSLDDRCITCRHQRRKVQYPERTQHGGLLMQMDVENVAPLRMTNIFTGTDSYSLLNFFNLKSQSMIWWTISLLRWSVFQPSSHPVLCCTRVSVFDSIYSSFGINVDISLELLSVTMLREPVETSYGPPFSTSTLRSL